LISLPEHKIENRSVGGSIPPLAPPPNFGFDSAQLFSEKVPPGRPVGPVSVSLCSRASSIMLALLDAGAVRPPTIVRYKLADAAEAHRVSEARHLQGKLVLEVR
jgi:hypothetical protein